MNAAPANGNDFFGTSANAFQPHYITISRPIAKTGIKKSSAMKGAFSLIPLGSDSSPSGMRKSLDKLPSSPRLQDAPYTQNRWHLLHTIRGAHTVHLTNGIPAKFGTGTNIPAGLPEAYAKNLVMDSGRMHAWHYSTGVQ